MLIKARFILLILLSLTLAGAASFATEEEVSGTDAPYLLPNSSFSIHFVRKADLKPHEVALRISQPLSISGCITVEPLETEIREEGPNTWITVTGPVIKIQDRARYSHRSCERAPGSVEADVILDRDKLIENGARMIALKNEFGNDMHDVKINEHSIMLSPRTSNLFKASKLPHGKDALIHRFYPENTIVLSVPGAELEQDVTEALTDLALKNGLTQANIFIKGFEQPLAERHMLYFVDQPGTMAKNLKADKAAEFGTIIVPEIFHGPDGPYEREKELTVLAKLPGPLD